MLLTAPLLSKSTFFGSLVNKCRQVIKNQPSKSSNINDRQTNKINDLQSSNSFTATHSVTAPISISSTDRPAAIANFSVSTNVTTSVRTLEEKLGLPPRPKKPLTPYFRYMQEQRPKILAENPKFSTTDIVRVLSKRWSNADAALKKRLQDDYKREQQEFVEIRAKYEAKMTDEQRAELKQLKQDVQDAKDRRMMRKRIKELGRPKKPASAFLRFLIQERTNSPQTPKQTYREWHQKCTEKWSRLSDKEKEAYLIESRKDMEVYKKEIALWEEKMVRLGNIDVVRHGNLIDPPEPKPKVIKPIA
ncbi:transcription factor A, mitochondrial isoform X1 [Bactrocera tryoni]|uniref:transcription factor A, mitochondrial isoform X1 n=1 Tax=Bactrocera tryoni TaxID=59916 RepID=UPI001A96AE38|nr:transcription factor A, mitochondrial isoform X1 [Bactrocera tryoni]XP_039958136.1 transcription factor A, mitochondrial isoform X1 [Bactrocera tryoni]